MKDLDDLPMTLFAAAVSVSPLAGAGAMLAPFEAYRLLWVFVGCILGVLWGQP